ncbi:MAG: cation:proton antiporter [Candidatus Diapherotrites archaeon]
MDILVSILAAFGLAFLLGKISTSLGIPRVVGYIFAGLILGSVFFREIFFNAGAMDAFETVANFGLILLFFFTGLKISLPSFIRNLKESFSISFLNTLFPFVATFLFALYIGQSLPAALILGLAMSVSAQAIIVDILDEIGLIKTKLGVLILSAGSVDDITELVLLTIVLAFIGVSSAGNYAGLVINLLIFVLVVVAAKIFILPYLFKVFSAQESDESLFGASLGIALIMAVLSSFLGIGAVIGALIAGILVRQFLSIEERKPWKYHKATQNIHLVGFGFFIPLFFVWVGLKTDLGSILAEPFLILILFTISFFLGMLGTWLGVRLNKGSSQEGLLVALGMATKGDVELAVGVIALTAGIITNQIFSAIVVIALISSVIPPILFTHFVKKYAPATENGKK